MDILRVQPPGRHSLHGFGLGKFLRRQSWAVQHIEEIRISSGIELIRAVQRYSAPGEKIGQHSMHDRCAQLSLDIVAITGTPASAKRRPHSGSLAMNTGMALTKATPARNAHSAKNSVAC